MVVAVAMTFSASAATIHRSFKSRDVGFGGGASVSVPVETKIAQALDAVAEKEAARTKVREERYLNLRAFTDVQNLKIDEVKKQCCVIGGGIALRETAATLDQLCHTKLQECFG